MKTANIKVTTLNANPGTRAPSAAQEDAGRTQVTTEFS